MMLCPKCNTFLVGPSCPCGWVDPFSMSDVSFGDSLPDYRFQNIEPQVFVMGISEVGRNRNIDEGKYSVHITRPFAIGYTEVSQDLYSEIMGENPSNHTGEGMPVDTVNWYDACSFCNALSVEMGLQPVYKFQDFDVVWNQMSNGFRLPTEAEWELSARLTHKFVCRKTKAWFQDEAQEISHTSVHKVEKNRTQKLWEWVWDYYGPFPQKAVDPIGPQTGFERTTRGGCLNENHTEMQTSSRNHHNPKFSSPTIGFRLVQTLFPEES